MSVKNLCFHIFYPLEKDSSVEVNEFPAHCVYTFFNPMERAKIFIVAVIMGTASNVHFFFLLLTFFEYKIETSHRHKMYEVKGKK